ncbi:hypothetical protein L873DRAFT_852295 [Choiromyces venosus 120613-1]|uniref:Arb2-like domain-containing protein n=1 Tax=Choiromyces venosus 120613-1 TaxID=1336337 RepID=A0A3N4JPE2_9PEZI|nr:hypothetical protein L873DRAFT_852295 [Choiromyces venosus 120613-1]
MLKTATAKIDPTYFYIRWAFEKQFGIIDVSLPPRQPSKSNGATQSLREQSESLCDYLWDNYIELQNAEHILLVGVEEGVSGLIHMLQARRCEKRVKALVGFICAANMQSILYGGIKDQALAEWYFNSSLLFVGSDHLFWENNKSRRRKYGNCKLTAGDVISTVMLNSQKDATDFMMNKVTDEASDTNTDTNHHNNGDGDANNKNSV